MLVNANAKKSQVSNNIEDKEMNNIEEKEIDKFEAVALRWWDLEGEFKFLHQINPLRLEYIAEHSGGLFGKHVLDIGCGGGILAESMSREGAIVTGLDVGFTSLQMARLHALKFNIQIDYFHETVEEHAAKGLHQYDVVTCMELLEHVPNPKSVVNSCAKLVRPGGQVFFSTINRNRKAWLMAIIFPEYLLRILPKGTHDMKKFITPAELLDWVDQTSLQEQHIIGIHYNPILDKFRLDTGIDVNYILHTTAKIIDNM